MDDIGLLVKAIIEEKPLDLIKENWKALEFVCQSLESDHSTKALEVVMDCIRKTKECPKNIETLIHFVQTNSHQNPSYQKTTEFEDQLVDISKEEADNIGAVSLIDNLYTKAYTRSLANIYQMAANIGMGDTKNPYTKETGPRAAKEYIKEAETKLYVRLPKVVSGDLKSNLPYVEELIKSYITTDTSNRLYTGFKKIDEVTLIGRNQNIRWVGILAYTHHGKSLFLNTMVYNMACHGANVLLCPREQSVDMTYMTLVWLHHKKVCPDRKIVSLADFQRMGNTVGKESWDTIKLILKDLKEGTTLKGKIFVEPCNNWEEIEEHMQATNKKNNYDVLAIDYLAHLDVVGNKKDNDYDKQKQVFRKAQNLTLNGIENDKKGLVIITPLQANKKGRDAAAQQDGDEYGVYESLGVVDYYTQAAQDMDCVIGLWFEGDRYYDSNPKKMLCYCLKGRGNMRFEKHTLELHSESGLLFDADEKTADIIRRETTDSLTDEEINAVLNTGTVTTSIDIKNWGL